ncbi:MAG: hypothetical protein ABI224_08110 [Acetobacteraceae bacterium]
MAMIPPNSQEGWYYDHWFAASRTPPVQGRGKRLLVTLVFLVATAGGIALATATPVVSVIVGVP